MANKRIDEATGTQTVGHEWDGIEELDTPMPRWWLWTFYLCIIWGIAFVIAYPAWPMLEKGTEGMLGWTSRGQLAAEMDAAEAARAQVRAQLAATTPEQLANDPALLQQAVAGGAAAFRVNCVQCHGSGAAGNQELGYPNLNDDDWLWAGDLAGIEYTLNHGIRQEGDGATRASVMPAFAGTMDNAALNALVDHVLSLSGKGDANPAGAASFAQNCALCHGPNGEGGRQFGAPRLNDAIWLRGSSREAVARQILNPRMGVMPEWDTRLDPVTIRMLAAYVHSLGGGEANVVAAPAAAAPNPADESNVQP